MATHAPRPAAGDGRPREVCSAADGKNGSPVAPPTHPVDKIPAGTSKPTWRDSLPVHPAAEAFPPLSAKELKELAGDIKRTGLKTKIVTWSPEADAKPQLLDGRNRLDALALLGLLEVDERGSLYIKKEDGGLELIEAQHIVGGDPEKLTYSFNLHRRHLTPEQKRERIAALLKADPTKSDRQIAKEAKTHHHAVNKVRKDEERRGNISHVEKRQDTKGRQQPAHKPPAAPPRPSFTAPPRPPSVREAAKAAAKTATEAMQRVFNSRPNAAMENELALREFAKFVLTRANVGGIDPADYDEWKSLRGRVKAILEAAE